MKFVGTEHEEEIRKTASPMVAARMGCSRKRLGELLMQVHDETKPE